MMGLVIDLEDTGLVIQVNLLCPRRQGCVGFRTADEDDIFVRQ